MTSTNPHAAAIGVAGAPAERTGGDRGVVPLEVDDASPSSRLGGLVATARPRQWVKNLLVLAAPGAAGLLTDPAVLTVAAGAFVVFCLAASGTYFLNDALGAEADRRHPTKRRRPVATGMVGVGEAMVVGTSLLLAGAALSLVVGGWPLALVVGGYAALQPLYSLWLRNVALVDLAAVASGFVLRAVAGGVAVGVPISPWFLVVTSFGSLFLVSGKRTAEHIDLGEDRVRHRSTLGDYSLRFLHHVRSVSSSVAVAAYCLWALEKAEVARYPLCFELSIVPLVLATLRCGLLLDAGRGGCPEELLFEDRVLQVLGLAWVTAVAVGVHAG